ncbi:hypothetical protein PoB_000371000 [Plakobranchus ocellatus]|uniref:Uncharacterized protein n=1 Tax=Plakobranchus ocellatus TaxID=259542 RepID=A0AAV3Y2Z6_9GAST|nr:hypothetical protein PoB_000371000 [Plakobranchus ocellatus]
MDVPWAAQFVPFGLFPDLGSCLRPAHPLSLLLTMESMGVRVSDVQPSSGQLEVHSLHVSVSVLRRS